MGIKKFLNNIKQWRIDRKNRKQFINDIIRERNDPKSKFNLYGVRVDEDYNNLSILMSIPEEMTKQTDMTIMMYINDAIIPVNKYIDRELNWSEYMTAPEFYVVDSMSDTGPSQLYLITWSYAPPYLDYPNFKQKVILFILLIIAILTGGIFAVIQFLIMC